MATLLTVERDPCILLNKFMNHTISHPPNRKETLWGFFYMAFQMVLLPTLLQWGNYRLNSPLNAGELNLLFFLLNFIGIIWIFHGFLSKNLSAAQRHPVRLLQTVILALAGYYACMMAVGVVISLVSPEFANQNDAALTGAGQDGMFLLVVGTVVLVPPVEECFYRGLLFRRLWGRSRVAAYGLSALAFSLVHVLGYVGVYTPLEVGLAILQYLPAGFWLAWAYQKSGNLFGPILTHAAVNAISMAQIIAL